LQRLVLRLGWRDPPEKDDEGEQHETETNQTSACTRTGSFRYADTLIADRVGIQLQWTIEGIDSFGILSTVTCEAARGVWFSLAS
jgi:hypothetical protein